MTYWVSGSGNLYIGDCIPGDRAATSAEIAAWEAANAPVTTYTFLQFMSLFTSAEQSAIVGSTDVQIKLFVIMAAGSGGLQLNNAEVIAGINYAASINLITQARAIQILAGQNPPTS